jgi:hypothetical protein
VTSTEGGRIAAHTAGRFELERFVLDRILVGPVAEQAVLELKRLADHVNPAPF